MNEDSLLPLSQVVADYHIPDDKLISYGKDLAKIDISVLNDLRERPNGKYVVITAITPTPLGEGKTTTAIGLSQALNWLGHKSILTLREPSMGPTFGIKGGASGTGKSQIFPADKLNLHLTGDMHAITAAHNLLAAMIDNHLHQGNQLDIDIRSITWNRVLDVNDRALRQVVIGLGARSDGVARQSGFDITAASEVGVILSLSKSLADLRERLGKIVIGFSSSGQPITAEDLKAAGAMAAILVDAVHPNLLQTSEHTPVMAHTGPFGNIATGNSSIIADLVGLKTSEYVITEAGFGSDMGAERFFNIKCRLSGLAPDAAVIVVTVRALKAHSGRFKIIPGKPLPDELLEENPADVAAGLENLAKHIQIIKNFGVPAVVAINAFPDDHDSEHQLIKDFCVKANVRCAVSRHVTEGGAGAEELAQYLVEACTQTVDLHYTYELTDPIKVKIEKIAKNVYGAQSVSYTNAANKTLKNFTDLGFGELPVVLAKTPLSISADKNLLGAPTGWDLPVRAVRLAAGAGYVYALCADIQTLPGLSAHPAAENIDLDTEGNIIGIS